MKNKKFIKLIIFTITVFPIFANARSFQSSEFSISGPSIYIQKTANQIYKKGGNVVDIAVASALTLSVTTPYYVSLGAGGFALVDMGSAVKALDFRETAPKKTHKNYFKDKSSTLGGSAVGVPGFIAGLWSLHQMYGRLKWKDLFKDALYYATNGYRVSGEWVDITSKIKETRYGMKQFRPQRYRHYKPGEKIKQPQLAKALKQIRSKNREGFYEGDVAEDIIQTVADYGGHITYQDLKNYKTRWLKPIKKKFNGYNFYIMPPPSSGGIVIASALELMSRNKLSQYKPLSLNEAHLFSEIMARAFRSRSLIADPDFHSIPYDKIMSDSYFNNLNSSISKDRVVDEKPLKETTHLVVMDKKGRTVSMTLTLNLEYGSKVVTSKYGIVLNNEMDDFTTHLNKPNSFGLIQGRGNRVEAGKRPLSSMSPTIVKKGSNVVLALGASGGPRIISSVLQVLYRTLVNGFDIDKAIQYPRLHHQFLPRKLFMEKDRWSPLLTSQLSKKGHRIQYVKSLAKVYGIYRSENQILKSSFDSRGDGIAWGL